MEERGLCGETGSPRRIKYRRGVGESGAKEYPIIDMQIVLPRMPGEYLFICGTARRPRFIEAPAEGLPGELRTGGRARAALSICGLRVGPRK